MDVVGTYSYMSGPSSVSVIMILSMLIQLGLIVFACYVGVKIVQACNIYIKEHKTDKKDSE